VSKHINVNPDHYKVAGRERTGNAVAKAPQPNAINRDAKERFDRRDQRKKEKLEKG
jgi:hypothetical protein